MAVNDRARRGIELDAQRDQPGVEDLLVLRRERREVQNARRERTSRAVQGTLLSSNARPVREPLPA